jgi:4-diphosphocytidyl-2-C-methyl-D-erythritol kinase
MLSQSSIQIPSAGWNTNQPEPGLPAGASGRVVWAPAKVNLFLELLHKRTDGYHELATVIVPVDLYDTLEIQPTTQAEFTLICDPPTVPTGPQNLVWKAADALRRRFAPHAAALIRLTKRIPHEAGLGGGSSDAAATLAALNVVWGLHRTRQELMEVAAEIGSDLPVFLANGAGWCTGRGEQVTPISIGKPIHLVIVKPPVGCSTAAVYQRVQLPKTPLDGQAAIDALVSGDPTRIAATLQNRLQAAAFDLQPMVGKVYAALTQCKPLGCLLSGSGSCVFAVCRDRADAQRVARRFETETRDEYPDCRVFVVQTSGAMT